MLDQKQVREDYLRGAKHIVIGALISDFEEVVSNIPPGLVKKIIYIRDLREYQMLTACQNVFLDEITRKHDQNNKVTFHLENNTVLHVRDFSRF